MYQLTVGSLFSGIGGIEYGLERTGCFTTVYQVETDAFCQSVLAVRYPHVQRLGDVRDCYGRYAAKRRKHALPPTDVLVGGFPCQDISSAGKQQGIEKGERSGVWREFARIISEVRPLYVLVENVAALRNVQTG